MAFLGEGANLTGTGVLNSGLGVGSGEDGCGFGNVGRGNDEGLGLRGEGGGNEGGGETNVRFGLGGFGGSGKLGLGGKGGSGVGGVGGSGGKRSGDGGKGGFRDRIGGVPSGEGWVAFAEGGEKRSNLEYKHMPLEKLVGVNLRFVHMNFKLAKPLKPVHCGSVEHSASSCVSVADS